MAPVGNTPDPDRGVVAEGPVGLPWLGRFPMFCYEVRRWCEARTPDAGEAVDSPRRVSADAARARRVLDLAPRFRTYTWGLDEQRTGDMWNSNSLVSWLLVRSGHDVTLLTPPAGGPRMVCGPGERLSRSSRARLHGTRSVSRAAWSTQEVTFDPAARAPGSERLDAREAIVMLPIRTMDGITLLHAGSTSLWLTSVFALLVPQLERRADHHVMSGGDPAPDPSRTGQRPSTVRK
jgi:hypothetical protein